MVLLLLLCVLLSSGKTLKFNLGADARVLTLVKRVEFTLGILHACSD
jgi:hypothetical protein